MALFQQLASKTAERWHYTYPGNQVEKVIERVTECQLGRPGILKQMVDTALTGRIDLNR